MANLFGLLGSNPQGLIDFGTGLLSASGPTLGPAPGFGQALATGVQNLSHGQLLRLKNQALRDEMMDRQRRRKALQDLPGLLSGTSEIKTPFESSVGPGMQVSEVPAIQTPEGQQQALGLLGQLAPDELAKGLLGQIFPSESGFGKKLQTVATTIGRPLTEAEVLKLAGGGTTINIGEKLNEPIPVSQLQNVKLPDGGTPPIGTTFAQARELGAQVVSPSDQQRSQQADSAGTVLDELESIAFGESGIFRNVQPGFVNRAGAALDFALEMVEQKDPNVSRFKDLSQGTVGSLIRTLGEKGALAEGDVQRALGLLPRLFPLPDTRDVAKDKIETLRTIIQKGLRNINQSRFVPLTNGGSLEVTNP